MNVAIVGLGGIAGTHAKALGQLKQNLAVVVGRDLTKAQAFRDKWGAQAASVNLRDALGPSVDCVHLCTPPTLHYEMALEVLQAGKHLVCEKPFTLDVAQARELATLAEEKNLLVAVNFNARFHEACQRAKTLVDDPSFGKVHLIHGRYLQEFHLLPADYMWRYIPALGGKMRAVTEIGSHWIDLARYWTGLEVEAVSATLGRFQPRRAVQDGVMYPESHDGELLTVDTEDAAAVTLRFAGGALGSMLLSEVSSGRSNALSLEVSSADTSVWWNSEEPYKLHQARGKFSGYQTVTNAFGGGFPDTFSAFFSRVYQALDSRRFSMRDADFPTALDGLANVAVCEAIWQSDQAQSAWMPISG